MRVKRIVKLINNERTNTKLEMPKACDSTSYDVCKVDEHDYAQCIVNSYDYCNKDHAACFNNGYDYCDTFRDTDLCTGSYDLN